MKIVILSWLLLIGFSVGATSDPNQQITKEEYVSKWSAMAVEQMKLHNIPASITLAQGLLESSNGNSELARNANNHFGIKCHNWTGDKYFYDDDRKQECFRQYKSAEQSYLDRSSFLKTRERYAHLFNYKVTDYKAWAKGLKAAGYATNPKYAELLINMIEKLKLYEYDNLASNEFDLPDLKKPVVEEQQIQKPELKKPTIQEIEKEIKHAPVQQVNVSRANKHDIMAKSNNLKYVVAKRGDTFYRISLEFGLSLNQMYRYNDFDAKKDMLSPGDIVYLMPKKVKGKEKIVTYKSDKTVVQISQEEGVKLKSLMKKNEYDSPETLVKKGHAVRLR